MGTDRLFGIAVNNTKSQTSGYPTGIGRNYGICYVFGGGNEVEGLTTDITISGGMCDTVFAGGNAADVGDANVLIDCPQSKTFTNAVSTWGDDGNINGINDGYAWNGTGLYNVRALFGGNNRANMAGLPTITLTRGSVGTVYGGCNISGDVGSEPRLAYSSTMSGEEYQLVNGATYVKASGGTVYGNLFAGSNGFYHCNNGVEYISGLNFGTPPYDPDELYVGDTIPTHNETHVMVSGTTVVKENVYAGGNMAYVGFINAIVNVIHC